MFTRPHEHDTVAVSGTAAAVFVAHFINHRLFAFTDAFDLTKSSDIADALLAKSGFEYVVRALLPLPLFLKECVIFLPRLHLVVAIFLLPVLYNLLCLQRSSSLRGGPGVDARRGGGGLRGGGLPAADRPPLNRLLPARPSLPTALSSGCTPSRVDSLVRRPILTTLCTN